MCCFFFFKKKTAYEMRISDWSSDVCSSDLHQRSDTADSQKERDAEDGGGVARRCRAYRGETGDPDRPLASNRAELSMDKGKPVVAIVDDDPRMLESLEGLLESADYVVRSFSSGGSLLASAIGSASCGGRVCQYV